MMSAMSVPGPVSADRLPEQLGAADWLESLTYRGSGEQPGTD